ncbi:MAG TPA: divalent-cation tolerance protein CutA [Candidatus Acidoferrales bacterium]
MSEKIVVMVACGSTREARRIAKALVEARLAACVQQFVFRVRSTYRWKGKVESANEMLIYIKTTRARFAAVSAMVKKLHSYDVPEIIALKIEDGSPEYLQWIEDSVGDGK